MVGRLTPLHKDDTELLRMRCMGLSVEAIFTLYQLKDEPIPLPVRPTCEAITQGMAELRELNVCDEAYITGKPCAVLTKYGFIMLQELEQFVDTYNEASSRYVRARTQAVAQP